MQVDLFSTTGCLRCKIVKTYLEENGIAYQEFDFKSDGKDAFNSFYRQNRSDIYRGEEGVEFPILYNGDRVIQGVGVIIAFLKEEGLLNYFVTRSELSHGWVSGLDISHGDSLLGDAFLAVVAYLNTHGLKTQIETDGRNAAILNRLIEKSYIDRLVFKLRGPAALYESLTGTPLDPEELGLSLSLVEKCADYKFIIPLQPFERTDNQKNYISPEEAAEAAAFVGQITSRKNHPFYIKDCVPVEEKNTLPAPNLFKYRTACRRHMVKTDIIKE